ncbi:uncharacterized protein LOC135057192 [Pseudophryne corroboree]|uniref:uncharacterized protein LOC135057192 n=1 Tax=Pseudophryne corroboree TaxID=495146 RepID=UPI0030816E78
MDQDKSHMTKSILKLTLEIIYLLTGEDCTVVKKISSEHVTPQIRPCVSGGLGRSRVPIMVTPPCSHERDNDQRILLLTDKIIQLLTGEVPIRCQDVTVHFSLEEWEYLEEHKDLYKDVMMENHQSFISLDRSSNRDAPERCPRPLYSQDCTDENHGIPQEDQGEDLADNKVQYKKGEEMIVTDIKVEYTEEEEETYVRGDQQCKEEEIPTDIGTDGPSNRNTPERCPLYSQDWTGENHRIPQEYQGGGLTDVKVEEEMYVRGDQQCKEEEIPTDISTADGGNSRNMSEEYLIFSPDYKIEDNITQDDPGEIPITPITHLVPHSADMSSDPSNHEQCSPDNSDTVTHSTAFRVATITPCSIVDKCFTQDTNLNTHLPAKALVKPFPCSECGKCFKIKSTLIRHEKGHTGEKPFPCSECGKCFTDKSTLIRHERVHTGEKPFPCSDCGKCYACKSHLNRHRRSHTGEKPYTCSECGKSFTRKSHLIIHERSHTGEKPFPCSECGKCFTKKSYLVKHESHHTGVKPFSRSECGKQFTQTSGLVRHERFHTGEEPFSCAECGKCFTHYSALVNHDRCHILHNPPMKGKQEVIDTAMQDQLAAYTIQVPTDQQPEDADTDNIRLNPMRTMKLPGRAEVKGEDDQIVSPAVPASSVEVSYPLSKPDLLSIKAGFPDPRKNSNATCKYLSQEYYVHKFTCRDLEQILYTCLPEDLAQSLVATIDLAANDYSDPTKPKIDVLNTKLRELYPPVPKWDDLFTIRQADNETVDEYFDRFKLMVPTFTAGEMIVKPNEASTMLVTCFVEGLKPAVMTALKTTKLAWRNSPLNTIVGEARAHELNLVKPTPVLVVDHIPTPQSHPLEGTPSPGMPPQNHWGPKQHKYNQKNRNSWQGPQGPQGDTGAAKSLLTSALPSQTISGTSIQAVGISGQIQLLPILADSKIQIGPLNDTHAFQLAANAPANLLGRDLLCKLGGTIYCTSDGIYLDIPSTLESKATALLDTPIPLLSLQLHQPNSLIHEQILEAVPASLWSTYKDEVGLLQDVDPIMIKLQPGKSPPRITQYPLKPEVEEGAYPSIRSLLDQGVLRKCVSSANSPIFPVKKPGPTKTYRIVQDLRALNAVIQACHPVVPNPATILTQDSANFMVEVLKEIGLLHARSTAMAVSVRWGLWLRQWNADKDSRKGVKSLPFKGDALFGDELDAWISKATAGTYLPSAAPPARKTYSAPTLQDLLQSLNPYFRVFKFKMESLRAVISGLEEGEFLVSLDIKDAYLHIPIWPPHQAYLRFALQNCHYQFQALPFGLSTAPRVFTKVMAVMMFLLRKQGVNIIPYMDDLLIKASSREKLLDGIAVSTQLLQDYGWILNLPKSHLEPMRKLPFQGMILDTETMKVFLPLEKALASHILHDQAIQVQSDNVTAVTYINRQGGTKRRAAMSEVERPTGGGSSRSGDSVGLSEGVHVSTTSIDPKDSQKNKKGKGSSNSHCSGLAKKGLDAHFQLQALPFGLSSAPRVFTKVTAIMMALLRDQGVTIVPYLYDLLIKARPAELLLQNIRITQDLLVRRGWILNFQKSHLCRSQRLLFLGMILDTVHQKVFLPQDKILSLQMLLCLLHQWSGSHLFLHQRVTLSPKARSSLLWWLQSAHLLEGRRFGVWDWTLLTTDTTPWNLTLVLAFLQSSLFEPLESVEMKYLTWKVVLLLALASARRVSELSCRPPYLVFHADRAELSTRMSFLPKVVSDFHINEPLVVPALSVDSPDSRSLDVVRTLKICVDRTKAIRKSDSLFVLYDATRHGWPASKQTLSRWNRLTIRQAYLEYTVVRKTSGDHAKPSSCPCVSGELSRTHHPITEPHSHSLIHKRDNEQKILELTNKIIQLLTGEEWEYTEEHKDLYNDMIMENHQPLTSLDGPSNINTAERCPCPLYSQDCTEENHRTPQEDQVGGLSDIKVEDIEGEEETYVTDIKAEDIKGEEETYVTDIKAEDIKGEEETYVTDIKAEDIKGEEETYVTDIKAEDIKGEEETYVTDIKAEEVTCVTDNTEEDTEGEEEMYVTDIKAEEEMYVTDIKAEDIKKEEETYLTDIKAEDTEGEEETYVTDIKAEDTEGEEETYVTDIKAEEVTCVTDNMEEDTEAEEETYVTDIKAEDIKKEETYLTDIKAEDIKGEEETYLTDIKAEDTEGEEETYVTDIKAEEVTCVTDIKAEDIKEEGETHVKDDQQCKEEEIPTDISTADGGNSRKISEEYLILSPDHKIEDNIKQDSTGGMPITPITLPVPHSAETASDSSNHEQCSPDNSDTHSAAFGLATISPCSVDGQCYTQDTKLITHQPAKAGVKSFPCSECGKCFRNQSTLIRHEKSHTGEKPFPCSECGKCFRNQSTLNRHEKSHTGEKPFPCSECGKCFRNQSTLKRHEKSHTGDKPFPCSECAKCFTDKSTLNRHEKSHTGDKPFPCSACGKCFQEKSTLIRHEKVHTGEKLFPCADCGKCYTFKSSLNRHWRSHTGEKPYTCSECEKCFTRKSHLIIHQRNHTGEKPFPCSECGKCFTRKSHLIIHQRNHTGEKPFPCSECGKCFTKKSYLNKHERYHTGVKPFTCSVCGKPFAQKSSLIAHDRSHTGEDPFS